MKTVLTEVAEQFHVSPEEVRAEIARAIHLALTSSDPEGKRRWDKLLPQKQRNDISVEAVIAILTKAVLAGHEKAHTTPFELAH